MKKIEPKDVKKGQIWQSEDGYNLFVINNDGQLGIVSIDYASIEKLPAAIASNPFRQYVEHELAQYFTEHGFKLTTLVPDYFEKTEYQARYQR